MKNRHIKFRSTLIGGLTCLLLIISSCSLEEEPYSIYTPDSFYANEKQVLSAMSGIYRSFSEIARMGAQ